MRDLRTLKVSIRTRILLMVLSLILVTFVAILAVFNLLVGNYIRNSVNEQLQDVTQVAASQAGPPPEAQPKPQPEPGAAPALRRPPRGQVGQAEALIVSPDYALLFPDASMASFSNYDDASSLATALAAEQADLQSTEIGRVNAAGREYYFVMVELAQGGSAGERYLVYYVDMTTITTFAARINTVLLLVMAIVGVLAATSAAFLADRIARPVRELTRVAARIGEGDFSRSAADYRDVELSNLANSLNESAGQLETYDKEQKTFFQNVSHELRTPLQVIKCSAEGIERGILDRAKSSRVIIGETDRLSEMVEDLLYLSRMDTLTQSSQSAECDLRELLSNAAERQRSLAAARGIQFVIDFNERPATLSCDEKSITRAFSNLVSNAIRYARTTIILSCHLTERGITISVADDGAGISSEDLPHIFDRFYHGAGGLHGIGLSIVKAVVKQHNGTIDARSGDEGTVFTITF